MFELNKKVRRDDPVFGSMLYMGDKLRYWEGRTSFSPTGDAIEVFVDGSSDDTMMQQHGFYKTVCEHWSGWIAEIQRKVQEETHPATAEKLIITSISIPNASFADGPQWDVSFEGQPSGRSYTVNMKGTTPESVSWDT